MTADTSSEDLGRTTVRQVARRLLPLLFLMFLIAYIDRQNVSYAKLQMAQALNLSEAAYGLGASLFFIGYCLFEAPSNVVLAKVGARVWLTRIMASWGLVTLALAFTPNAATFYALRFLLGVAEAGFFPGVIYMMTLWFPAPERGRMIGWFLMASAVANAVGAALGGMLLDLDGLFGIAGWQWVFLTTSIPAIVLAPVIYFLLPPSPDRAPWLSEACKGWLARTLADEHAAMGEPVHGNPFRVLADARVWLCCVTYMGMPLAAYGLSYWLPTVVKGFGVSNTANGFLNILPWVVVAVGLYWVPRHAAKTNESTWHIIVPCLVAAASLVLSVVLPSPVAKFAFLCLAAGGILACQPVFWTLPASFMHGAAAAAGIAVINSIGNLGGFIAQSVVPLIRDLTGSTLAPMFFLAACLVWTCGMVLLTKAAMARARKPALG
jgi:MFS family permease